MRIRSIHELSIPVSRHADPKVVSGGLTTSLVAVTTDVMCDGEPVVGYGFASDAWASFRRLRDHAGTEVALPE